MTWATVDAVLVRKLEDHPDTRGCVRETYRSSWFEDVPPVRQMVRSESKPKVMRAMHAHKRQWDIWHFVSGAAMVVLYDLTGRLRVEIASPGMTIAIPPGVAHGFYTDVGCILTYLLTEEYDGTDEFGFDPFDPDFPGHRYFPERGQVVISDRDLNAPSLGQFRGSW